MIFITVPQKTAKPKEICFFINWERKKKCYYDGQRIELFRIEAISTSKKKLR